MAPEHWHVLVSSLLARLLDGYETYIIFVVLTPSLRDLLEPAQLPGLAQYAGLVLAAIVFGRAVGGLVASVAADYIGRKRTLLLSFLLYAASALLSALSPGWRWFALFRLLTGASFGGGLALGATLIAESWPTAARARGQSLMQSAFGVGAMLAAGFWLVIQPFGGPDAWRWPLFLGILPTLALAAYTRRFVPESKRWLEKHAQRKRLGRQPPSAAALTEEDALMRRFTLSALFSTPRLRRQMLLCMTMSLGTVVGYWAVASWIPAYVASATPAADSGDSPWSGLAGLAYGLGSIPGYLVAGWLADTLGRRSMLACYFAGSILSTQAMYVWSHAPWFLVASAALHGFFTQGQFVWFAIYPPELFPTAVRSTALGAIFNSARFLSLFGPLFAGVLITRLGGYSGAAQLFSLIYAVALCAVPFLPETKGKTLPA